MLEDWEDVLVTAKLYDIHAARQRGEEKGTFTGRGAPILEIYNWSIFDRLSGAFLGGVYIGSHPPLDYAVTRGANEKT